MNILAAQSGGPTAAINATLAGVLKGAFEDLQADKVFGALNGIEGVLSENFKDMRIISICSGKPLPLISVPAEKSFLI